jgi:YbbR domain-containing protein
MAVKKLDKIEASLDITGLTTSQTVEVPITKPSGIKSMTFDKIDIEVKIEEKASKTFTNLSFNSARCDQVCYGVSGEPTTIDITVEGPKSTIDQLTEHNIIRYCNAEGKGKGYVTGEVRIGFSSINKLGVTYTPSFTTCKLFVGR